MALKDVPGIMNAISELRGRQQESQRIQEEARHNVAQESLEQSRQDQAERIANTLAGQEEERINLQRDSNLLQSRLGAITVGHQIREDLAAGADPKDLQSTYGEAIKQLGLPNLASIITQNKTPPSGTLSFPFSSPQTQQPPITQPVSSAAQPVSSATQPVSPIIQSDQSPTGATTPSSIQPSQDTSTIDPTLGQRLRQSKYADIKSTELAKTQGEEEALTPGRIQANQWREAEKQNDQDFEQRMQRSGFSQQAILQHRQIEAENDRNAADITSKGKIAVLDRGTQMAIENARNKTSLMLGGMYPTKPDGTNPIADAATASFLTGQRKMDFNNPIDRVAATNVIEQGGRDVSGDGEALQALQQVSGIYDRMEKWNNKYGATNLGGQGINKAKGMMGPELSGVKQYYDSTISDFNKIAQSLQGLKAIPRNLNLLNIEKGGIIQMGALKKDNADVIQQGRDRIAEAQKAILAGVPPIQKVAVAKTYGVDLPKGSSTGTVRMKAPNGDVDDIPINNVQAAKAKGAVEVQ